MLLKTILNRVEKHASFVYQTPIFLDDAIYIKIKPRSNSKALCSICGTAGSCYDTSKEERKFSFVPLWGIAVFFLYCMRRVDCKTCKGVKIEAVPWAVGKSPMTTSYAWFLASWAKRLSWKETANCFKTSWDSVFRAVEIAVRWGLKNRDLRGIEAIGVDEVLWHRGHKYLTVVYEITLGRRRLLWIGKDRKEETIRSFFSWFEAYQADLKYVCSDMWKPYLKVIKEKVPKALNILDRFHIVANINKAIDKVRAEEVKKLKQDGYEPVLKSKRWVLLKRPENLTHGQSATLKELLKYNLKSVRAYLLKEDFQRMWDYTSPTWAGQFMDAWCNKVMRSRIDPLKKVARSMRSHRELILNWFKAEGALSSGAVEGLNNKLKLTTRKSYGFRTFKATEIALYHAMGDLPEPKRTHRFF